MEPLVPMGRGVSVSLWLSQPLFKQPYKCEDKLSSVSRILRWVQASLHPLSL